MAKIAVEELETQSPMHAHEEKVSKEEALVDKTIAELMRAQTLAVGTMVTLEVDAINSILGQAS